MSEKLIKLSDGVQGLFVRNARFKTTLVSFNIYLPLKKETVADYALLPFILTSCSKKYPDFSKLNYKLSKLYGATLSASTEKLGDCQLLRMVISVINDEYTLQSESLVKQASELMLKLLFEPNTEDGSFLAEDVEREKRKAIEHIRGEFSEKRIYAKNRLIEEMFKGEDYGISKCGSEEDVEAITGASLYKAWEKMLRSAFIQVQVIGSAVPEGLFDDIKSAFMEIERETITNVTECKPIAPASKVNTVEEKMQVAQGKLVMGFSSDVYGDDDTALPLMVATDIFGGGPYSRLFSNVREKMSLCYYCSASSVRAKGLLTVESGVEFKDSKKAQKEILNQLDVIKKGEFTDFEYESSLKSIKDSLMGYDDSQSSLDLWYALKIANKEIYSPQHIAEKITQITREDVVNAARGIRLHTVYKIVAKETE